MPFSAEKWPESSGCSVMPRYPLESSRVVISKGKAHRDRKCCGEELVCQASGPDFQNDGNPRNRSTAPDCRAICCHPAGNNETSVFQLAGSVEVCRVRTQSDLRTRQIEEPVCERRAAQRNPRQEIDTRVKK